jgi:nucleoside-diphosphate-sugar epimerase
VNSVVLLGVGNVALHVAKLLSGQCTIYGTTRSSNRVAVLEAAGIVPLIVNDQSPPKEIIDDANVLVSFPPDGTTDAAWSAACVDARRTVYISSTGVYGKTKGVINEESPVDVDDPNAKKRLDAEDIWRNLGAIVLRCPGLYGPESGMHLRLKSNGMKIPGDGTNYVSRIHLDDLATIVAACFENGKDSSTYVLGDLQPSTQLETISWLCEQMGLALPDFVSLSEVSPTLRGNRRIDSSKVLADFDLTLRYPTYREGYGEILN